MNTVPAVAARYGMAVIMLTRKLLRPETLLTICGIHGGQAVAARTATLAPT